MKRALVLISVLSVVCGFSAWGGGQDEDGSAGTTEEVTITLVKGEHPSSPIYPDAPVYQAIREKTGIILNIEAIPSGDYNAKRNLLLATDQVPDILNIDLRRAQDFADSGSLMPLIALIDKNAPDLKKLMSDTPEVKKVMLDDELWYFPIWDLRKKMNAPVPMIRKDLLDDNGLEMPDNFEELYAVLKKLKEIYPQSFPWSTRSGTRNLLNRSAYPMGIGYSIYYDKDIGGGQWVYGTVRPEFKEVLAFFNKAYEEGVLDPDFAVNTADQWHEKMGSGRSFFYYDNMTFGVNYTIALRKDKPNAAFWPVPVMENSIGRRNNYFYPRHHVHSGYGMGANTDHADRITELFNWMVTLEGWETTNWGVEGVHYTKNGSLFDTPATMLKYGGDVYEVKPDVLEEYKGSADPQRAMRSNIGSGLLQFTIFIDQKPIYYFDPPMVDDWYKQLEDDDGMLEFVREPPFTADEREKLKKLKTDVDNILIPALDSFIIGNIPLDDFEKISEQAIKAGALEIEKIYNDAEARIQ